VILTPSSCEDYTIGKAFDQSEDLDRAAAKHAKAGAAAHIFVSFALFRVFAIQTHAPPRPRRGRVSRASMHAHRYPVACGQPPPSVTRANAPYTPARDHLRIRVAAGMRGRPYFTSITANNFVRQPYSRYTT
jgi:hypothetical protein